MTLLQILDEKGISVDEPVLPWLPASWIKGYGVEDLTFRDLLEHRSGLGHNATATAYRDIVRERVLWRSGVNGDCKPSEVPWQQTLMYEFPYHRA